ncbi:MAG TPA: hypothetical protein VJQ82_03480 [Terriglobales bacterium]|nr:hypothetical protein [Terriglobales bacterium]
MSASKISKGLLLGLAVLLATVAFASNKGSLNVTDNCTVAGKQLNKGDYKVSWEGNGPDVQVSIMKGKEVVATVPAHMTELSDSPRNDSAVLSNNGDGSKNLAEIRFAGKKYALAIGTPQAAVSDSSK